MPDVQSLPLPAVIGLFAAAAVTIGVAGVRMANTADRLADLTGVGEAIAGAVLLGVATSLSGTIAAVAAAADGFPRLSFSTAVGGIAVQTFFLAVADMTHREANLEHAAASSTNLAQCAMLIVLLSLPLMAMALPPYTIAGVHPVSVAIVVGYVLGLRLARHVRREPPWGPAMTPETRQDVPDEPRGGRALKTLAWQFLLLLIVLVVAGLTIARTGEAIAVRTELGETVVGVLLTSVSTSLPELVTTLAAVRRNALTLAVGGIVGGNTFDVVFLTLSDAAYRDGSIYHAVGDGERFVVALSLFMAAVVLLGLLGRQKHGPANIGFESVLVALAYVLGVTAIVAGGD